MNLVDRIQYLHVIKHSADANNSMECVWKWI